MGSVVWGKPVHPLVRQLGSPNFASRVAAERELLQQGIPALEWIEAGLQSNDREIRQRSHRLSEILRKSSLVLQLERVREDPWTVPPELAPAWEVYQALAGDGEASRKLYVGMIQQESELMLAVGLHPEGWVEQFDRRCADLRMHTMDRRVSQSLHPLTVLTILFLAEHPDNKPNMVVSQTVTNLVIDPTFYNFVQSSTEDEAEVCRGLLSEWVARKGLVAAPTRLEISNRYQLSAGVVAAREMIANRNVVGASRTQLQHAIRFIAVQEPLAAVQDLEPLLNLSGITLPSMKSGEIPSQPTAEARPTTPQELQAGDLALLGLIQLTGQDPQSYGFANVRIDQDRRYNTNVPLITSEKDRRQALLRWYSWRTSHPMWFRKPSSDASEGLEI